ncbi:Axonemal dynein light intermediate polypeptide 1 [Kappamyces sp. JEL0829]|nr:Axonemal dynein light intermediate polypeptide 1 [Kappamyces sp. JEL0829]
MPEGETQPSFSELFEQLSTQYPDVPARILKFADDSEIPQPNAREMQRQEPFVQDTSNDTSFSSASQPNASMTFEKPEAIEQIATLVLTASYPASTLMKISENAAILDKLVQKYYGEWRQTLKQNTGLTKEEKAKSFVKITFQLMDEARPMITDPMATLFLFKYLDAHRYKSDAQIKQRDLMAHLRSVLSENQKLSTQRTTLENISREMQRKYREIQEENKRIKAHQETSKTEMEAHFQAVVKSMKISMEKELGVMARAKDDRNSLKTKFKAFLEEYQTREKHFQAIIKTKDSEYALIQAKHDLLNERLVDTNTTLKTTMEQLEATCEREQQLLVQNQGYVAKLKEAEDTLSKSNEMFMTYRSQLDLMTEKLKGLQREHKLMKKNTQDLDSRCTLLKSSLETSEATNKKLESLCRALQAERLRERQKKESTPPLPDTPEA